MAENSTRVIISAEDRTAAAFASATRGLQGMERHAQAVQTALAGIGVTFSAAAAVAFVKGTIDAADGLNDLSQRLGIARHELAGWTLAAKLGDTTIEALGKGIKGLSTYIQEHGDKLRQIGVDTQDPQKALTQLSDIFRHLPDDMDKTALAVKLFGKAGMDLIPLLNQGGDALTEQRKKAEEYGRKLAAIAPDAEKFNDNLDELAIRSKGAGIAIAQHFLPGLIGLSQLLIDIKTGGKEAQTALEWLDEKIPLGFRLKWSDLKPETRSRGFTGQKNAQGLPATEMDMFDRAMEDWIASGGMEAGRKRREAAEKARKLLDKPAEKDTALEAMLKRGQQNLMASLDSEEEMRIVAAKREMEMVKKEFEDLQRMIKKGEENELAQYYETAGEETMRLVADQRALQSALRDNNNAAKDLGLTFASAFEDAIVGGKDLSSILQGLAMDVQRIFVRKTVTEPMAEGITRWIKGSDWLNGLFKFEGGGIMTSAGPVPLRQYAGGGIANRPQLALFGEGSTPEAFVPVPNGRIPVQLSGEGGGAPITVNLNFAVGIAQTVRAEVMNMMPQIQAATMAGVVDARRRGGAMRAAFA